MADFMVDNDSEEEEQSLDDEYRHLLMLARGVLVMKARVFRHMVDARACRYAVVPRRTWHG